MKTQRHKVKTSMKFGMIFACLLLLGSVTSAFGTVCGKYVNTTDETVTLNMNPGGDENAQFDLLSKNSVGGADGGKTYCVDTASSTQYINAKVGNCQMTITDPSVGEAYRYPGNAWTKCGDYIVRSESDGGTFTKVFTFYIN